MKNKHIHELVKQLNFDVRTCEENIRRLADDLIRVERLFSELWTFVYKHKGELAEKPELQMVKCHECENWTNNYRVIPDADNYVKGVICKTCLEFADKKTKEGPEII